MTIFESLFSSWGIDLVAEHSCQVFTQTFPICNECHGNQNYHIVGIVTKMWRVIFMNDDFSLNSWDWNQIVNQPNSQPTK